jgi:hypothetical protein
MSDREHTKHIERMLEVMMVVPPCSWALLLAEVENRVGTDELQRIIERVYHETDRRKIDDLKRAVTAIKRQ